MFDPARTGTIRKRAAARTILAALVSAGATLGPSFGPALATDPASQRSASIPNFAPSSRVGWLKIARGDEFLPPESGPGPVVSDLAHPYVPSGGFNPYLLNPRGDRTDEKGQ
jgi:hypothetical protein